MTNPVLARARRMAYAIPLPALTIALSALAGCQTVVGPSRSGSPVYSTDLAGKAASCTASEAKPVDGQETEATIETGGGGWCGIATSHSGSPFAVGLLAKPANHGKVYIHTVGDDTRIDYTPYQGTSGPDSFAIRLIPGDAVIRVSVNSASATGKK